MLTRCQQCKHVAFPGRSTGLCSVREDLPKRYGTNHPLRELPADNGRSCELFEVVK